MANTIRRNPFSVNVSSLDESYFNFAQYKGLCTNKNYVSIDQQSFSEVNNMYVNQDDQLSTRPPVKQVFVLDSKYKIKDIIKIDSVIFYHVQDTTDNTYKVLVPIDGFPYTYTVGENVHICWFNQGFAIFSNNVIYSIRLGTGANGNKFGLDWLDEYALYVPITKIVSGTEISEAESPNIFTTSYRTRYLFQYGQDTLTSDLIGKTVEITVDGDTWSDVNFVENEDKVFYKKLGTIKDVDIIDARVNSAGVPIVIAYNEDALSFYVSIGGVVFSTCEFPSDVTSGQIPVISNDGEKIYLVGRLHADDNYGVISSYFNLYSKDVTSNDDFISSEWNIERINFNLPMSYNAWIGMTSTDNQYNMMTSTYQLIGTPSMNSSLTKDYDINPFGYSTSDGDVVYFLHVNDVKRTAYLTHNRDDSLIDQVAYYIGTISCGLIFCKSNDNVNLSIVTLPRNIIKDYGNCLKFIAAQEDTAPMIICYKTNADATNNTVMLKCALDRQFRPYRSFIEDGTYGTDHNVLAVGVNIHFTNEQEYFHSDDNPYGFDCNCSMSGETFTYRYVANGVLRIRACEVSLDSDYNYKYFADSYEYPENLPSNDNDYSLPQYGARFVYPVNRDNPTQSQISIQYKGNTPTRYKMSIDSNNLAANYFVYYNGGFIPYLPGLSATINIASIYPAYIQGSTILWYNGYDDTFYTNEYEGTVLVDYTTKGKVKYLIPNLSTQFITTTIATAQQVYISEDLGFTSVDGTPVGANIHGDIIYVPESSLVEYPSEVTAFANFASNSLGVFLENSVYELQYTTRDNLPVYISSKSKLQLGNRKNADVLMSYDGNMIFVTTIKGLNALTYQDFTQNQGQVYNYLSENIMTQYQEFATEPIKLYQYKDYVFLYKKTSSMILMIDTRTASWWIWNIPYNIEKIIYTDNLYILSDGYTYKVDFDDVSVMDNNVHPFDWSFVTQMLHFDAPNNYKHIRSVSIVTSQPGNYLRFKMYFKNYRNLNNLSESDTVYYDIDQLTTMIKRVNFIKTNAFQVGISNDVTDMAPKPFVTSNVSIKYRITERVR